MNTKPASTIIPLLTNVAIIIGLIIFVPFIVIAIITMTPTADPSNFRYSWVPLFGIWNFFVCAFFLGYLVPYLFVCSGIILTAIIVVPNRSVRPRQRITLALLAVCVGILAVTPYQPAVLAADGYEMVVPTQPVLPLRGLKRAQSIGEIKPCAYKVIGWQDEMLYYSATCSNDESVWQINPNKTSHAIRFTGADLPELAGEDVEHTDVLDQFRTVGVSPASAEYSVRELSIRGTATFSPNGEWLAVVSRHIYAAEDVLIVRAIKG